MNIYFRTCLFVVFFYSAVGYAQTKPATVFKVIPLGIKGGIDESNLSAYLLAAAGTSEYICLDAGTLNFGIQKAVAAGLFRDSAATVLKNQVKAYLISHPHLDHVSGLIINSPDDGPKNIYGLAHCLDVIKSKYFSWDNWANFGDEGDKPVLKKYHYSLLEPGKETLIEHTTFSVRAFALSHGNPYESSAFLVKNNNSHILYLGDTGADSIEKANNLQVLWKEVAPLITSKQLKAIFIEVSYPNEQPYNQLFGHLTPQLLMQEMNHLAAIVGNRGLAGLPVVITHMKPSGQHEAMIKKQLLSSNKLQLKLVFPQQAKLLRF